MEGLASQIVSLGGRIAEEIALDGRKDAGASNDIERASELARLHPLGPTQVESPVFESIS